MRRVGGLASSHWRTVAESSNRRLVCTSCVFAKVLPKVSAKVIAKVFTKEVFAIGHIMYVYIYIYIYVYLYKFHLLYPEASPHAADPSRRFVFPFIHKLVTNKLLIYIHLYVYRYIYKEKER